MPINELLVSELTAVLRMVEGNSLTGLRAAKDFLPTAIAANQRRLNQLRSTESLMLQKLRRELSMQEIDGQRADIYMKVEPMQSFLQYDTGTPDPHTYIIYDVDKLQKLTVGMQTLISGQKAIASEIKGLVASIRDLNNTLESVNKMIAAKGTEAAMEKDRIAERSIAELFALYEIYTQYRDNSQDADGNVGYTSDQKLVKVLEVLQIRFSAIAERNPYVLNGSLVLDTVNPGSAVNGVVLTELIEKLRQTANPGNKGIVDKRIQKYADSLVKNINDKDISVGINRRTESKDSPDPEDALKDKTATTSKMVQFTQKAAKWWTKFDGKKFSDKATEAFKWRVKAVYGGLPFCGEPEKSAEEKERDAAQAKQKTVAAKAAEGQAEAAKAAGVNTEPTATPVTPVGMEEYTAALAASLPELEKELFSAVLRQVSKYLRKQPGDVTENDLIKGYQQNKFGYIETKKKWEVIIYGRNTTEAQIEESKILYHDMSDYSVKANIFKTSLIEYRENHGNRTTIATSWWENPVEGTPVTE